MSDPQIAILVALVLGVLLIIVLVPRQSRMPSIATESEIQHISTTLDSLNERVTAQELGLVETNHNVAQVRQIIGGQPTRSELHKVELEMRDIKGRVETIDRSTQATQRMVESIDRSLRRDET